MRELKYKVLSDKNHIEPRTRLWAGMQFEDNVTEIIFDLTELGVTNALYRIDFNSAGAGYQPSENLSMVDNKIKRAIPKYVTQYGGDIQVTAVITLLDDNNEEMGICLSYPVIVYLTEVEKDSDGSQETERNISAAEASALNAAERANNSAASALKSETAAFESKEKTEAARRALEEDSEFVFSGGDAQSVFKVDFVIDTELSASSLNPIASKPVYEGLENLNSKIEANKQEVNVSIEALSKNKENASNKVKVVSETSSDEQYPTAKCLYDNLKNITNATKTINYRLDNLETQNLLWDGAQYESKGSLMMSGQKADLKHPISEQSNGVVLVFQPEENGIAAPNNFNTFFIPKQSVIDNNGQGRSFPCFTTRFTNVGLKYIYISDNELRGADGNADTGSASGITYNNKKFFLTKVYGV